jgi:hypothetical protein
MKPIKFPAILEKMNPRKDKSWKLEVETRELSGKQIQELGDMLGSEMWVFFAPNPEDVRETDIPEEKAEAGLNQKSLSQRLYNVLYVYWDYIGKPEDNFSVWREKQMNRLMQIYKDKLPDRKM